jgi:sugar phosphate isomerase/epimerase
LIFGEDAMRAESGKLTRRYFLGGVLTTAVSAAADRPHSRRLRLGGPIFKKSKDPAELAREHRRLGYRAAYCPMVELGDTERIEAIRKAFAAEDVVIAEVGAWVGMLNPSPEKARANLQYITERLALAEAVGARTCVTVPGSFHPKGTGPDPRNYSREFFDATVENCRKVIDAVKPTRTKLSIEMLPWSLPDGADSYLRLFTVVDRPGFGVHIDVCNTINSTEKYFRNAELTDDLFRTLGRWVLSCHAKDLWGYKVHLAETVPGRGGIDYRAYLRAIATYAPEAPLMLEHLDTAEEYQEGKAYIMKVGSEIGIEWGA